MPAPLLLWGCGALLAATTSTTVQLLLKPRLPLYNFRVTQLPRWQWRPRSSATNRFFRIPSHVSLHNDNLVSIDVHALSFDLYVPTFDGSALIHLGHVMDKYQQERLQQVEGDPTASCYYYQAGILHCEGDDSDDDESENGNNNLFLGGGSNNNRGKNRSTTPVAQQHQQQPPHVPPLWSLAPRATFSVDDDVYVSFSWFSVFYSWLRWIWNVVTGLPHLQRDAQHEAATASTTKTTTSSSVLTQLYFPSTGVLHVKATQTKTPLTLSIVCDNVLNPWTLAFRGVACSLHRMDVGWWPLERVGSELRNLALTEWTPRDATTGSVVESPQQRRRKKRQQPQKQKEKYYQWQQLLIV